MPSFTAYTKAQIDAQRASDAAAYLPTAAQFHGARYTAYGHSFGQVQATPNVWAGALYPARLRDLLHTDPALYVNRTVSGAEMALIASTAASTWADGSGGLVTLMGNQNDVGHHTSAATFKAALRSFLTTMLGTTGKPPTVLVIKDTTLTAAAAAAFGGTSSTDVATYNGYLDAVIAEFPTGWIITADPLAGGWNPATMTAADGQHPNERGMACITAACLAALAAAPYRPGLNVGVAGAAILPASGSATLTSSAAPTVSGATTLGAILTATAGSWSAAPDAVAFQWNRGGIPITGATTSTYTVVTADQGTTLTVTATATKAGYTSSTSTSTGTAIPAAASSGNATYDFTTLRGTAGYGAGKFGNALTAGVLTSPLTGTARTVEAWMRATATTTTVAIRPGTSPGWIGLGNNGTAHAKPGGFADLEGGAGANDGNWHHVALVIDGSTSRLFLDGVHIAAGAGDPIALDGSFAVGGYGADSSFDLTAAATGGAIDEVRVSATARYTGTGSFTPPTGAFTADADTLALWHLDGSGANAA